MIISILGCGWLGLPLAEQLRDDRHTINGSTTTEDKLQVLKGKSIRPFYIKLDPDLNSNADPSFWDAHLLILNIPPGRNRKDVQSFHRHQIEEVVNQVTDSPIKKVIFISSTSVYPAQPGIVAEADATPGQAARPSGNALLEAEQLLRKQTDFNTIILRFGGLYGYKRHPITHLAGRKNLDGGSAPVNLIHRDDCTGIIKKVIKSDIAGGTFNAVSDGHPPKSMYYPAAAKAFGYEPPTYKQDEAENGNKIVSNSKLKKQLGYKFKYPNPMDF
ncbi:MAG TPA: SDR family oxidoreductase [Fodinibius sp.]|nr:SDR family oxidoreductase [Fodinibius sp.]